MKKNKKILIIFGALLIIASLITGLVLLFLPRNTIGTDPNDLQREAMLKSLEEKQLYAKDTDDADNDKLSDQIEKEIGTNINKADTDDDGLSDGAEYASTKTNPLKPDTDGDGVPDGIEYLAGLDPLNPKTDGKTSDAAVEFTTKYEITNGNLEVTGGANIYNIYADTNSNIKLNNYPGVVSEVYEFYIEGQGFTDATLSLKYNDNDIKSNKYNEETLSIYQYIPETEKFVKVNSKVDTKNNTVTAELEHFSYYLLADSEAFTGKEYDQTNIYILLDNSGSMYSAEKCPGSDENDVDFKRIDFATNIINSSNANTNFATGKFTATYTLLSDFGTSKEDTISELESIRTCDENFNGTHIKKSCTEALKKFKNMKGNNYLIVLTDGVSTQ